jgi:hypothetical protein
LTLSNNTVAINSGAGTTIGTFTTTDPNPNPTPFTFALVNSGTFPDNNTFIINGNTLSLTSAATKSSYTIDVQTTDAYGLTLTKSFTISALNPPTAISLNRTTIAVGATGAVGVLSTTDPNQGAFPFTYTLVNAASFPDDNAFTITGSTLSLKGSANQPTYKIDVQTTDAFGLMFTQSLTIHVQASTPPATLSLTNSTVSLGNAGGVGSFLTTDPNPNSGPFTYALVNTGTFPDNADFSISGSTLSLTVPAGKPSYTIDVQVTDAYGLSLFQMLTIGVTSAAPPTALMLSNNTATLGNAGPIGLFSTTDPNPNAAPFTYALVDPTSFPDDNAFTISGSILTLAMAASKPSYTIDVETTDAYGLSLFQTMTITVMATAGPSGISLSKSTIAEGSTGTVGTLSATDPNPNSMPFAFSLVNANAFPDDNSFSIIGNVLTLNTTANQPSYGIEIEVADAYGQTFDQMFTITVTATTPPSSVGVSPSTVALGSSGVVGTFVTNDPNPNAGPFTYALVNSGSFPDDNSFSINGNTLSISSANKGSYHIEVQVTDAYGLSLTQPVTITATSGATPNSISLSNFTVSAGSTGAVGNLTASDANANAMPFSFALVNTASFPDNSSFSISGNTLSLITAASKATYTVDVQVTDALGLSADQALTISVTGVPSSNGSGSGGSNGSGSNGSGSNGSSSNGSGSSGGTSTSAPKPVQTIGAFDPSTAFWFLRNENNGGAPDAAAFQFGLNTWLPITGDWNGDGTTTIGMFDPATATWYLRNENSSGAPDAGVFQFGAPGWIPVVGDWNGTGHTGIGMYDPTTATWFLRNEDSGGAADAGIFQYGVPNQGWTPLAGDWNGNGKTGIGVYDPLTATFYLRNEITAGAPDAGAFSYGLPGWKPVSGDFGGTGHSGVAVVDPLGNWYIRFTASAGAPNITPFNYGLGTWTPVTGDWDFPALPEQAAGGALLGTNPALLTGAQLQDAVSAALARLQTAGVSPAVLAELGTATYSVADLSGDYLGLTDPNTHQVWISDNADGYGWFTDPSSASDSQFGAGGVAAQGSAPAGKMDLLTVVLHEMAHLAGRSDEVNDPGLMAAALASGTRHVDALDSIFSTGL